MRPKHLGNKDVVLLKQAFEQGQSLTKMSESFGVPRKQIWSYIIDQNWERKV